MEYHGVPLYLRRTVGDFLQEKRMLYTERGGRRMRRAVVAEVSQGSVLGDSCGISGTTGFCGAYSPRAPTGRVTLMIPWSWPVGMTGRVLPA